MSDGSSKVEKEDVDSPEVIVILDKTKQTEEVQKQNKTSEIDNSSSQNVKEETSQIFNKKRTFLVGQNKVELVLEPQILRDKSTTFRNLLQLTSQAEVDNVKDKDSQDLPIGSFQIQDTKNQNGDDLPIIYLQSIEPKELQAIIKFLNGEDVKWTEEFSMDEICRIWYFSQTFKVPDLFHKISAFFASSSSSPTSEQSKQVTEESQLNDSTVCQIFQEGKINVKHSKADALNHILKNAGTILEQEEFLELTADSLKEIIGHDELQVENEVQVFQAVLRWGQNQCKKQGIESTRDNLRMVLKEVLPLVRFPLMSESQLALFVYPSEILDDSQWIALSNSFKYAKYFSIPRQIFQFNGNPRTCSSLFPDSKSKWVKKEQQKLLELELHESLKLATTRLNTEYSKLFGTNTEPEVDKILQDLTKLQKFLKEIFTAFKRYTEKLSNSEKKREEYFEKILSKEWANAPLTLTNESLSSFSTKNLCQRGRLRYSEIYFDLDALQTSDITCLSSLISSLEWRSCALKFNIKVSHDSENIVKFLDYLLTIENARVLTLTLSLRGLEKSAFEQKDEEAVSSSDHHNDKEKKSVPVVPTATPLKKAKFGIEELRMLNVSCLANESIVQYVAHFVNAAKHRIQLQIGDPDTNFFNSNDNFLKVTSNRELNPKLSESSGTFIERLAVLGEAIKAKGDGLSIFLHNLECTPPKDLKLVEKLKEYNLNVTNIQFQYQQRKVLDISISENPVSPKEEGPDSESDEKCEKLEAPKTEEEQQNQNVLPFTFELLGLFRKTLQSIAHLQITPEQNPANEISYKLHNLSLLHIESTSSCLINLLRNLPNLKKLFWYEIKIKKESKPEGEAQASIIMDEDKTSSIIKEDDKTSVLKEEDKKPEKPPLGVSLSHLKHLGLLCPLSRGSDHDQDDHDEEEELLKQLSSIFPNLESLTCGVLNDRGIRGIHKSFPKIRRLRITKFSSLSSTSKQFRYFPKRSFFLEQMKNFARTVNKFTWTAMEDRSLGATFFLPKDYLQMEEVKHRCGFMEFGILVAHVSELQFISLPLINDEETTIDLIKALAKQAPKNLQCLDFQIPDHLPIETSHKITSPTVFEECQPRFVITTSVLSSSGQLSVPFGVGELAKHGDPLKDFSDD